MEGWGTFRDFSDIRVNSRPKPISCFGRAWFFQILAAFLRIFVVGRPNYHLNSFGQAERFLAEVSRPNAEVKLLFDVFHCQILHGYWTESWVSPMQ